MAQLWPQIFKFFPFTPYLWVFPQVASLSWFTTLTILLVRWLSIGQPRYPGQVNPDVPFISDIAAFTFKPIFVVGCTATAISFAGTVFAVHHVRYSPKFYGLTNDAAWRQTASVVALIAGLAAATSLVFLSVFDTVDAHVRHRYLLMGTFGGLGLSAICTTAVWWDQVWGVRKFRGLRKWTIVNTVLMLLQAGAGISFVALMYARRFKPAGYLEWITTYLGSFWLLTFVGYTRFLEREDLKTTAEDAERQPLLVRPL